MSGMVSIVMPSYNTCRFIAESIRSVLAQTYTDWELIIVDDCSTDDTMKVIAGLPAKIRIFQNEHNSGAAFSRNLALREARGKYIAFLDSDDLWAPDKLEKQIRFMEENGYDFTYTEYGEIDENGAPSGVIVGGPRCIGKIGMYNYCWPGCLTVMYNREVVGDIQIADIRKNNDYAMWLKVVRKADCHLLPENLGSYRKRGGSISHDCHSEPLSSSRVIPSSSRVIPSSSRADARDPGRYLSLVKWHYKLYREAESLNPVASLWLTVRNLCFGMWKKVKYVRRG